jgi:lycopene cyclase domain-containing protein
MTYFNFLAVFIGLPLALFGLIAWLDTRRGRRLPAVLQGFPFQVTLILHVAVALLYTTPWDNYLVATGVWYYNPDLIAGITLGYVPLEEYTFFVVQTLLTGLWLRFLALRLPMPSGAFQPNRWQRWLPSAALALLWVFAVSWLVTGWKPGTYLGLILGWAIPPILIQFIFGGDILFRHGRLVLLVLGVPTLYLAAADFIAIGSGTWTIDPNQSLNIFVGGVLPVEEFIFFLVTNTLISLGSVLFQAQESHARAQSLFPSWSGILKTLQPTREG